MDGVVVAVVADGGGGIRCLPAMSETTLHALIGVTLWNLYWCVVFLVCSATYTGYTDPDYNLDCVVEVVVVAGPKEAF